MLFLYSIAIRFYFLGVLFAWPFRKKVRLWIKGRREWKRRQKTAFSPGDRVVWFHCASLGEFEQGRPLMESFRKEFPEYKILLTFFSSSGYEIRRQFTGADVVGYIPADTPLRARRFLEYVNPVLAVFIKYEFWLNHLREIHRRKIPLLLVSGIFRPDQIFFKSYGMIFWKGLRAFHHFYVQTEESVRLLHAIGYENVTLSGDTRFDRVAAVALNPLPLPEVALFCGESKVLIGGSLWPPDEEVLDTLISKAIPGLKFILAPHEVSREHAGKLLRKYGSRATTYSAWKIQPKGDPDVMILDTVGILAYVYRFGHYAYIGGGFGAGIHNILEAAVFGIPLFFGPNYRKFREAADLKKTGGAFPVRSADDFMFQWMQQWENAETSHRTGEVCHHYVSRNLGATSMIMRGIKEVLHKSNEG